MTTTPPFTMSGPEHYCKAEHLLESAADATLGSDEERYRLAAAQVHATLALAAATALASYSDMPVSDATAWDHAAGVPS